MESSESPQLPEVVPLQMENPSKTDRSHEFDKGEETSKLQIFSESQDNLAMIIQNSSPDSEKIIEVKCMPVELNEESKEPRKRTQKFDDKMLNKECRLTRKEAAMRVERDKVYFEGYSEVGIHEEMIMDTVRTEAYREAIEKLVKDQVVADIGAGSGILSIFAAVSGAKKVFAIEKADIVSTCRQNIKERNLE